MIYDDKGYVIRNVELMDTGHVFYRGMKDTYANEKDATGLCTNDLPF